MTHHCIWCRLGLPRWLHAPPRWLHTSPFSPPKEPSSSGTPRSHSPISRGAASKTRSHFSTRHLAHADESFGRALIGASFAYFSANWHKVNDNCWQVMYLMVIMNVRVSCVFGGTFWVSLVLLDYTRKWPYWKSSYPSWQGGHKSTALLRKAERHSLLIAINQKIGKKIRWK